MAINNNSGEVIQLDEAIEYTHAFQEDNPESIKAFFAGINKINHVLGQEDCIGIRFYSGLDPVTGVKNLVLVGVNQEGEDITEGVIVEKLITCPTICAKNSALIKP